jgi:hypothetical protein
MGWLVFGWIAHRQFWLLDGLSVGWAGYELDMDWPCHALGWSCAVLAIGWALPCFGLEMGLSCFGLFWPWPGLAMGWF